MHCPFCRHPDSRVIDSRATDDGTAIRRRRQCPECGRRFTTVETAQLAVVKRSGATEPFSRDKVLVGVRKACQGRPVERGRPRAARPAGRGGDPGQPGRPRCRPTRSAWRSSGRCASSTRSRTCGSPSSTAASSRSRTSRPRSPLLRAERDAHRPRPPSRRTTAAPAAPRARTDQPTARPARELAPSRRVDHGVRPADDRNGMTETVAAQAAGRRRGEAPRQGPHDRARLHDAGRAPVRRGHLGAPRRRHDELAGRRRSTSSSAGSSSPTSGRSTPSTSSRPSTSAARSAPTSASGASGSSSTGW